MIWVDADACPKVIKQILYRAAERIPVKITLVANRALPVPKSPYIQFIRVETGFDIADHCIVGNDRPGDLVVTGDIPLAAELIDKGCIVLSPRGELYDDENIRERLNIRDFFDTIFYTLLILVEAIMIINRSTCIQRQVCFNFGF